MSEQTHFYSVIHPTCSCRGLDGKPRRIGVLYRQYYKDLQLGKNPIDILNVLEDEDGQRITRMCCRSRFLSIPVVPMIDRSRNRILNDSDPKNIRKRDTIFPEPKDNLNTNSEEHTGIILDW